MPNPFFQFKEFTIFQDQCAMKVTTDGCLFGAWVAQQIANQDNGRALDIGAGTGLLSLMVAQKSGVSIDAVEIDEPAAAQAVENINRSPWHNRIQVYQKGVQDFKPPSFYGVIFSNPPFYENELPSPKGGRNLAHHGKGLRLQELLEQVIRLLEEAGTAYLLFPFKRADVLEAALAQAGLFVQQKVIVHPSETHPPFRVMLAIKKKLTEPFACEKVYIKSADGHYTTAFIHLLQDYYLYL